MPSRWTLLALCFSALYTKCKQHERRNVVVVFNENKERTPIKDNRIANAEHSNIYDSVAQIFRHILSNKNRSPSKKIPNAGYYRDNERFAKHPRHKYSKEKYRNNHHRQNYQMKIFLQDDSAEIPYQQSGHEYRPNRGRHQRGLDYRNRHQYEQYDSPEQNNYEREEDSNELYSPLYYNPRNQHRYYQNQYRYNPGHSRHHRGEQQPSMLILREQEQSYEQGQWQDLYNEQQTRYQNNHQYYSKYRPRYHNNNQIYHLIHDYQQQKRYNQNQKYKNNRCLNRYYLHPNRYQQNRYYQNRYQHESNSDSSSQESREFESYEDSREGIKNKYTSRLLHKLLRKHEYEKPGCEGGLCINVCDITPPPPVTACAAWKYNGNNLITWPMCTTRPSPHPLCKNC